jgi:PEP-CTERM motif
VGASLLAAAALGSIGTAHADLIIVPSTMSPTTDVWTAESGQSVPTGTAGFVGGSLVAETAGTYKFTYGPPPPIGVAGGTGHGNSILPNEFWVGANELAAEAAGNVFCTQPGDTSCGGVASTVGQHFTLTLAAGPISFGFTFGPTNSNVLLNGQRSDSLGAYIAQLLGNSGDPTVPNDGPSAPFALLGLSDSPYPGDHDFQDLTVLVTEPEPASIALLGSALLGMAFGVRRKISKSESKS